MYICTGIGMAVTINLHSARGYVSTQTRHAGNNVLYKTKSIFVR